MMRIKSSLPKFVLFLVFSGLLSCVTVNIYFPAEEVRRTAEEIVGEVRQETLGPQSRSHPQRDERHWTGLLPISFGIATAHAQSETTVSNAAIRAIKERLKARDPQLTPYFKKGVIGENNRGYVEIRNFGDLDMKSKASLKRLVDAEVQDRRQLYQEIARALNVNPGQLDRIESIFAAEWQKSARPGWYIQKGNGEWVKR